MTDFERIYRENFPRVYGFLVRLCRNDALAEELAQETFFRALRAIGKFDGRCRVDIWLCQIAKNAYFSHCRRQKKRADVTGDIESPLRLEDTLADKDQAARLHERLHALEEPYKEVFMLRVFGELDHAQIGQLFGRTESWSRVTYHRAVPAFRWTNLYGHAGHEA